MKRSTVFIWFITLIVILVAGVSIILASHNARQIKLKKETCGKEMIVALQSSLPIPKEKMSLVHANQGVYTSDPTPELVFRGFLRKPTSEPVVGFFLPHYLCQENGEEITVDPETWLEKDVTSLDEQCVEIRGKYTQLDQQAGGGKKLRVGYIAPLPYDCRR